MNRAILIIWLFGILPISCSTKKESIVPSSITSNFLEVPDKTVNRSMLLYDPKTSRWHLDDELYSGFAVSYYEDGTFKEKFGILNGRKHGQSIHCYKDGHYRLVANYQDGKLDGDKKSWSSDSLHTLVSHFKFVSGKPHGEQLKWYLTGELFTKQHMNMGEEEGLQQAFRTNGDLYANYEARNGRIFGLKKSALCYSLEDEEIKLNK